MSEEAFPRTCAVIESGIAQGLHRGVQVFISQNFAPVADFALGEDSPGKPLLSNHLLPWLSAGKPLTAVAILRKVQADLLALEAPVCDVIPEFAANGKEHITVKELLTHTAGLKPIATGWPSRTWQEIVEKICVTGLKRDRGEGRTVGYDPARSWFILGELLQRTDSRQRKVDAIVREDVLEPLGMMNSWMAVPDDYWAETLPKLGQAWISKEGVLTAGSGNTEEYSKTPSPGGSMRGPIRELGRFYEMLLRKGAAADGRRLLSEDLVIQMTARQRENEFDVSFQHVVDFGLGIIINSNRYGAETVPYGFGRYASEQTFGHGGAQCSIGFADPEHQLVVAAVANGLPGDEAHNQRFRELGSAIYEDLGLA